MVTIIAAVAIVQRENSPQSKEVSTVEAAKPVRSGARQVDDSSTSAESLPPSMIDLPLSDEQIARVDAYLELENTRQEIQDYFDDPEGQADNAQVIMDAINALERDGRVIGFEAMHLKLSWLALNSPDEATYEAQAAALVEDYAARDRAAQEAFKPESIPGYTDYKTREAEIIAEVNGMDSFPQGQTRQQYLRERLLEARIEAYGEGEGRTPPQR